MSYQSQACLHSEHVAKYLVTLCRHFARKTTATWDEVEGEGRIEFSAGIATLTVNEAEQLLTFVCRAETEQQVTTLQAVISKHMVMFARRETVELNWQPIEQA
ncbi:MAG: DUF2218 domain-containing protein [Vibrio sp.]|uniref:DUF2218 domain-containing protein n=1 Tax=Vibrio chanodichtyis TaxID=3027932 RepID=A0ABT5V4U9_9VIBR|nr:DUF2218 domain-containing protein [Vibrio chanodichtyis]MDE1515669.1 DUF2218 domain-containing protein [Vibrio chanodichtyis]